MKRLMSKHNTDALWEKVEICEGTDPPSGYVPAGAHTSGAGIPKSKYTSALLSAIKPEIPLKDIDNILHKALLLHKALFSKSRSKLLLFY